MSMSDNGLDIALQRFDLPSYVREHGGVRVGRSEWMLDCPSCLKDKLSVNVATRFWRCFTCEEYARGPDGKVRATKGAGNVFRLVQWMEQLTPAQTAQRILDEGKPKWLDPNDLPLLPAAAEVATTWERCATGLPAGFMPIDGNMPYMQQRGITLEDARAFGLGWVSTGWLANRLVFPVWHQGHCLYWQARAMWDAAEHEARWPGTKFRKTLNPSVYFCTKCHVAFPEGKTRCGLCNAPQQYGAADVVGNLEQASRYPRVAIVEGPTSGIRAGPSAVWTFGKVLHPQQIAALVSAGVRAVDFMWDGPAPGRCKGCKGVGCLICNWSGKTMQHAWVEMIQAASQLASLIPDVRLIFLPKGDPGDWPREHLDWFRSQGRPFEDNNPLVGL